MKKVVIILVIFFTATLCFAATIHVPADQPTIQAGIDATSNGDTVLVADGVYLGSGNRDIDFGGREIVVRSAHGAQQTTVDCEGSVITPHQGFIFKTNEDSSAILDGFTIAHAFSNTGAVCCSTSSPTIRNCVIIGNSSAGIYIADVSAPKLENCGIVGNSGSVVFVKNNSGGPPLNPPSSVTIRNCSVSNNGGTGIWIDHSYAAIDSSNILANDSSGVWSNCFHSRLSISNSLVWGNGANGLMIIYWEGFFRVTNCTIFSNGSGLSYDFELPKNSAAASPAVSDSSRISNCIVAFNQDRGIASLFAWAAALEARCNDSYGNPSGNYVNTPFGDGDAYGNFSLDPLFCDRDTSWYIADISPCAPANNSCHELIGRYGVACALPYLCGDCDHSGLVNVSDAIYLVNYIFGGGPAPVPLVTGDANCDSSINISDAVYLIHFIFSGGPVPCAVCK